MIELLNSLREFCLKSLSEINLHSKDRQSADYDTPEVKAYIGEIPGELEFPRASDFPLLILRLQSFEDPENDTLSTLTVRIIVGTYSDEESNEQTVNQGYLEMLNILKRLRRALLVTQNIGGRWRREGKIEGGPFDYQAYPYWFGDIIVKYNERQITEEFDADTANSLYINRYRKDDSGTDVTARGAS